MTPRDDRSATAILLAGVVVVGLLASALYIVWKSIGRDEAVPSPRPAPALGEVDEVNPFDTLRVDEATGTWVMLLTPEEPLDEPDQVDALVRRVAQCREFVATGRFLARYPDAAGRPVGLRVETGRPLAPEVRARVDAELGADGPVRWVDPPR